MRATSLSLGACECESVSVVTGGIGEERPRRSNQTGRDTERRGLAMQMGDLLF